MSFPYVVGTDIIQISRLANRSPEWLIKLTKRILHPTEIVQFDRVNSHFSKFYKTWNNQTPLPNRSTIQEPLSKIQNGRHQNTGAATVSDPHLLSSLAGRWAAKEAARKAWGAKYIGFKDVRICIDPEAVAFSNASKIICQPIPEMDTVAGRNYDQQEGMLSISHDGDYAIATVIAQTLRPELQEIFLRRKS